MTDKEYCKMTQTRFQPFSILWDLIRGRDVSRVLGRLRWERHLRREQKKKSK